MIFETHENVLKSGLVELCCTVKIQNQRFLSKKLAFVGRWWLAKKELYFFKHGHTQTKKKVFFWVTLILLSWFCFIFLSSLSFLGC